MKIDRELLNHIASDLNREERRMEVDMRINRGLYKASMRIAMKIKRAMRLRNISQVELSRSMDMDPAMLSRYLSGKFNMELRTMVKFEEELGISIINRNISDENPEQAKSRPTERFKVMVFHDFGSFSPKNPTKFSKFPVVSHSKGYKFSDLPVAEVREPQVTLSSNDSAK